MSIKTTAGQVLTLFLLMAAGFALKKLRKLSRETVSQISFILLYIVNPCLILRSMQIERGSAATGALLYAMAGAAIFYILAALLVVPLFRRQPADTRDTLRFGCVYTNNSFMGFPLVLALFGPGEAAVAATGFLAVTTIFQWTHGVRVMNKRAVGEGRAHDGGRAADCRPYGDTGNGGWVRVAAGIRQAVVNPGMIAFIIGLALYLAGLRIPVQIGAAVSFLADVNTPLAMIVIGAQMADANLLSLFRSKEIYLLAALKLIAFPVIGGVLIWLLQPPPIVFAVIIILSATPTAGLTGMFAQNYNRDTATAAKAITFTTVLSIVTLPVISAIVMNIYH